MALSGTKGLRTMVGRKKITAEEEGAEAEAEAEDVANRVVEDEEDTAEVLHSNASNTCYGYILQYDGGFRS